MNKTEVVFTDIRDLKVSLEVDSETKVLVAKVSLKLVDVTPVEIARILNMQRQKSSGIDMALTSTQVIMDIGIQDFMEVDRKTN